MGRRKHRSSRLHELFLVMREAFHVLREARLFIFLMIAIVLPLVTNHHLPFKG